MKSKTTIILRIMRKNALNIWKKFTIGDFVATIVFLVIAAGMGYGLNMLATGFRVILGIVVFLGLESLLLPVTNTYEVRVYNKIYDAFKFLASTKKYKWNPDKKQKSSSSLVPYLKEKDNFTIENTALGIGKHSFLQMIKVSGFDIRNLDQDEQDVIMNNLNLGFQAISDITTLKIIKLDDSLNLKDNKTFLEDRKQNIKKDKALNKKQKEARLKIVNEMLAKFENNGPLSEQNLKKEFYIALISPKLKELMSDTQALIEKLRGSKLTVDRCLSLEIANVIKKLLDPSKDKITDKTYELAKKNFEKLFSYQDVTFNAKNMKNVVRDSDGKKHNIYTNISAVKEYPVYPDRAWFFGITDIPETTVIMTISNTDEKKFEANLNKAIQSKHINLISTSKKDQTNIGRQEADLEILKDVVDAFAVGREKFKHINTIVINRALTEKALDAKVRETAKVCKENDMVLDTLTFHQYEGYEASLLKQIDPLYEAYGRDTTTSTIAEAFPFITTSVVDKKGVYFAKNTLGEPVIVDFFANLEKDNNGNKLMPSRINANAIFVGETGSGKSTAVKNLLLLQSALGRRIIAIDPEHEYSFAFQFLGGIIIDAANGSEGRINPLQPLSTFIVERSNGKKDIYKMNKKIIQQHVRFLNDWFSILYPDMDNWTLITFKKMVSKLYEQWLEKHPKLAKKPIEEWKTNQFPIFDDFINFVEHVEEHEVQMKRDLTKEILFIIKNDFTDFGEYADLYNGYSTIKTNGNKAILFDLYNLKDGNSKVVVQAQMMLITAYIQDEIKNNFFRTDDNTILAIDEAHLLIDEDNPVALDFIYTTSKLIRKRASAIWLATQNLEDFMGSAEIAKKTKATLNNFQYWWNGHMKSKNIEAVSQLNSESGGLTSSERAYISGAESGRALFMTSGTERQNIIGDPLNLVLEKGLA